jgi:3-oxoadipate enol-lactonase
VLRYDTRGHGGSDAPPGPYSLRELAEDVRGLLAALGIARTHFVGLSMGGMIGQQLAILHPELFGSLVLADTLSAYPPAARSMWEERIAAASGPEGMEPLVEPTCTRWFTQPFRAAQPDTIAWIRTQIRGTPPAGFIGCCRALMELNLTDRLPELDIPTLIMVGRQDPTTTVAGSEVIHRAIAGSHSRSSKTPPTFRMSSSPKPSPRSSPAFFTSMRSRRSRAPFASPCDNDLTGLRHGFSAEPARWRDGVVPVAEPLSTIQDHCCRWVFRCYDFDRQAGTATMTGIRIEPVAESAFALMDQDQEEKDSVEQMAARFQEAANWFARKKMFLDLFEELDATADIAAELADSPEFVELFEKAAAELRDAQLSPPLPPGTEPAGGPSDDAALPAIADEDLDEDLLPEDPFAIIAPVYIGAILERLGEQHIVCLEQAAFYFLSTHPEHNEAATQWIEADQKRLRLYQKFLRANPGYRGAVRRIMAGDVLAAESADE